MADNAPADPFLELERSKKKKKAKLKKSKKNVGGSGSPYVALDMSVGSINAPSASQQPYVAMAPPPAVGGRPSGCRRFRYRIVVAVVGFVAVLGACGFIFRDKFKGGPSGPSGPAGPSPAPTGLSNGLMSGMNLASAELTTPLFVSSTSSQVKSINGDILPDNALIDNTHSVAQASSSSMFSHWTDMLRQTASKYGVSFQYGEFSASTSYTKMRQSTYTSSTQRFIATASREVVLQTVTLPTGALPLHPDFEAALSALPQPSPSPATTTTTTITDAAVSPYVAFVAQWGTHFVSKVVYGGMMHQRTEVDASFVTSGTQSSETIAAEVGYLFDKALGVSASGSRSFTDSQLQQMMAVSETSALDTIGGTVTATTWQSWLQSLSDESTAAVISQQVTSISAVLDGDARQPLLEAAITTYLQTCPHNTFGVCSGRGACDFTTGTCSCDSSQFFGDVCKLIQCPAPAPGQPPCGGPTLGSCDTTTGVCTCVDPYFGPACAEQHCPVGDSGQQCSAHGTCNTASGTCSCEAGWKGTNCGSQCGVVFHDSPKYELTDGSYLPADHCGGDDGDDCGQGPANNWCSWRYQSDITASHYSTVDMPNTKTEQASGYWPDLSFSECDPAWVFHECNPFTSVTCNVPCSN